MTMSEIIWGLVGFLLTIMILSYLLGDNFFFRLAAYSFIGLTAGYLAVLLINQILRPHLFEPLIFGSGTARLWVLVPLALILLLALGQIRKLSFLANIPLGFLAGMAAAVTIGGALFGTLLPQTMYVIEAFDLGYLLSMPEQVWVRTFSAVVMLVGAITTLSYFYFGASARQPLAGQKRPALIEPLSKIGQVFIGLTLGAVFAGVFSTALLALIDRIIFIGDFFINLFGGG